MVLLVGLALVMAVVMCFGGRPGRLAELQFTAVWLVPAALVLQMVAYPAGGWWSPSNELGMLLGFGSYACLLAFTAANRKLPGAPVIGVGMALNLLAMSVNGGHMPATPHALRASGRWIDGVHLNEVNSAHPALPWLVDRFATPSWVPLSSVFSAGDILIVAGAGILLWRSCGAHLPRRGGQQPVDRGLAGGPSGTP